MKTPLHSLKGLVTCIVLLAIMPTLALVAYSGYSGAMEDIEEVRTAALRSVGNIARQQTQLVENTRILLFTLSNLTEVRDKKLEDCSALFRNLALHAPAYADIRLCDTNGNTLAASSPDFQKLPEAARAEIRTAAADAGNAFAVREMTHSANNHAPLITCLLPVIQNGRATGVLLASIFVRPPAAELAKLDGQQAEHLHIVDKQGHIIFAYPPDASEPASDHTIHCPWREVGQSPLSRGLIQDENGQYIAFEKLSLDEEKEPDLTISLSISTAAVFERMRARIFTNALLLFGATGFAFAVTWKLCDTGLRAPVRKLLDAAHRIKDGDLGTRIPENFMAVELDILAASLNSMTQSLEARDRELIAARDAATAASNAKSEFLANMSHEIRTPMNAILGMAYLAKNSELTKQQQSYLDAIQEEAGALLAVINDILDFSKLEAGKVQIETVSFALPATLREVLEAAKEEARNRSVAFSSSLAPDLPEFLNGDPLHLSQALSAVLGHAMKHAERGRASFHCLSEPGVPPAVTLSFTIAYADAGTEHAAPVTLAGNGTPEMSPGIESGQDLGLAIARNLVRLMRGTLETRAGSGTEIAITVRLPFSIAETAPREKDAAASSDGNGEAPGGAPEAQAEELRDSLKGARILLVEDNPINQQIAAEILTDAGASVHIASNGLEALALLDEMPKSAPYHVVLMDLQMPELDGLAATRRLRLDERFKSLPVIAMTAHSLSDEWRQCQEAGMNDYIAKPIDVPVLLSIVGKWMHTPVGAQNARL